MISLGQFARLHARIEHDGRRDAALASAGLSPGDWIAAQREHLAAIRASLDGDGDLARRYLDAYARARDLHEAPQPEPKHALRSGLARLAPAVPASGAPTAVAAPVALSIAMVSRHLDPDVTAPPVLPTGPTLPFRAPIVGGEAPAPLSIRIADSAGATVAVDDSSAASLPFEGAGAEIRLVSLTRYAALAAELRTSPANADAILTQHGLATPEQRQGVHSLWKMRFEKNPPLRERFAQLVEELCANNRTSRP